MRTSLLVAIIAIVITGCKKDTFVEDIGKCPVVVTTDPENTATNVALNKVISIVFNEEIDPESITNESITINGAAKLDGVLSYDNATFTVTFTPAQPLTVNTTYSGKVLTTIEDYNGNHLQANYVWTFSTGTVLAPMVVFTDPNDLDTGVVLNKVVTATFSEPMDPSTINGGSFTLFQGTSSIAGTVEYNDSVATFTPTIALVANTEYTATITTEAKNPAGTTIPNNYVWTFTTGAILAPPTVISTDPADGDSLVALNKTITATFSEAMNGATITNTSFTLLEGTTPITGVVSYAGTTASFNPSSDLLAGQTYTATITIEAENLAGTALAQDYVWSFKTLTNPVAPAVDLQSADRFGILAGVGVSNMAGFSEIHDLDVGISPGVRSSVTGFPPAIIINGDIYASDDLVPAGTPAMLIQAKQDLTDAYLFAEGATAPAPITVSGDIGGVTLAPGIYKTTSTLLIQSGDLTLDAQGDANAFWIFQIASGFTTVGGAGGNVILTGGAQAKNVFWQCGSSVTIGDFTDFKGNVLALTSITMNSGATAQGRMLARNGSVVMTSTNTITKP